MVDQGSACRLDYANADIRASLAAIDQVGAHNLGIEQQLLDLLRAMQEFDHAGPVVGEWCMQHAVVAVALVIDPLFFRQRRVDVVAIIHARQRAYAVPAVLRAERREVRKLHVTPVPHLLPDVIEIVLIGVLVEDDVAVGVPGPQLAVVEFKCAVGAYQAQIV